MPLIIRFKVVPNTYVETVIHFFPKIPGSQYKYELTKNIYKREYIKYCLTNKYFLINLIIVILVLHL